jgi:hypothetical protein
VPGTFSRSTSVDWLDMVCFVGGLRVVGLLCRARGSRQKEWQDRSATVHTHAAAIRGPIFSDHHCDLGPIFSDHRCDRDLIFKDHRSYLRGLPLSYSGIAAALIFSVSNRPFCLNTSPHWFCSTIHDEDSPSLLQPKSQIAPAAEYYHYGKSKDPANITATRQKEDTCVHLQ